MTQPRLFWTPQYDMGFPGLENIHPFDGRKFSRAHAELSRRIPDLARWTAAPDRPADDAELQLVHTPQYLAGLESPEVVLGALELRLPGFLVTGALGPIVKRAVVTPMRWAVRGTMLAAESALTFGSAVNLGGGFHHAKPDRGEGFCLFADAAIAVRALRAAGKLGADDAVAMIDLDAHMGNGVATAFADDRSVRLFDMYNAGLYPYDPAAEARIDCAVRLRGYTEDAEYLRRLNEELPRFLDKWGTPAKLAFYNAGTDVFEEDDLGRLNLSAAGVLARDRFVFGVLKERAIPWVMVTSGGYSGQSWRLVADGIAAAAGDWT